MNQLPPPAPEYPTRAVSNFFENSRRYSQLKVTPVANLPPGSLIPLVAPWLANFEKIQMTLMFFWGLGEDDSWKNLKQKSRDTVPLNLTFTDKNPFYYQGFSILGPGNSTSAKKKHDNDYIVGKKKRTLYTVSEFINLARRDKGKLIISFSKTVKIKIILKMFPKLYNFFSNTRYKKVMFNHQLNFCDTGHLSFHFPSLSIVVFKGIQAWDIFEFLFYLIQILICPW